MRPQEYNELKALSQSSIKMISFNPRVFYDREERWLNGEIEKVDDFATTRALDLGSITDCLLLTPEVFHTQYAVINSSSIPKGQMFSLMNFVYSKIQISGIEDYNQHLEEGYNYVEFKREKFETIRTRFETEALPYIRFMIENRGKIVINDEDFVKASSLKEEALNHEFIGKIFSSSHEKLTQLCVSGEISGLLFKGLVDLITIDHENRKIYLYDLKTSSDSYFPKSYYKYRYDIQQNVYSILVEKWVRENYPDYELMPMSFIVLNTQESFRHGLWINQDNSFKLPINRIKLQNGIEIEGLGSLIDRLKWHRENGLWDHPREVYEQNGFNLINL